MIIHKRIRKKEQIVARGVLTVEKGNGRAVRVFNELVGPHLLARLAAGVSGAEAINLLNVDDTSNAPLVTQLLVDSVVQVGTDAFATWRWLLLPGVGTGQWDDVYVVTVSDDILSQFLSVNGTIGEKLSTDTWFVTYRLYFIPVAGS